MKFRLPNKYFYLLSTILIFFFSHVLYYKLLSSDVILGYPGSDSLSQGFLFTQFAWKHVQLYGEPAWYNPYLFCGMPFIESCSYTYGYPLNWIFLILPTVFAFGYQYVFHLFIIGEVFFITLSTAYKKRWPALAGALFLISSAHIISLTYPGHGGKFFALLYLFPMHVIFTRILKNPSFGKMFFFIILGILQIFTGHLQIVFYTWLSSAFYALCYLCVKPNRIKIKRCLLAGFLFILIFAGSYYKLTSFLNYKKMTVRSKALEPSQQYAGSLPAVELSEIIWPHSTGYSPEDSYDGDMGERLVSDFVLPVILLLSLSFFLYSRKNRLYYLLLLILSILISLGKYNFLNPYIYTIFPFFKLFRAPMAILCLADLALIITAIQALNNKLYEKLRAKDLIIYYAIILPALIFSSSGYFMSPHFYITGLFHLIPISLVLFRKHSMRIVIGAIAVNMVYSLIFLQIFIPAEPKKPYLNYLYQSEFNSVIRMNSDQRILFPGKELNNRYMMSYQSSLFGYHPLAPANYLKYAEAYPPEEHPQLYNIGYMASDQNSSKAAFHKPVKHGNLYLYKTKSAPTMVTTYPENKPIYYAFRRLSANRFKLNFSLKEDTLITIRENSFPGWQIFDNDKEIKNRNIEDYPFMVLHLKKGSHSLIFEYHFRYWRSVILMSSLFLFGLIMIKYGTFRKKMKNEVA